jgi:hypothetical protein
LTSWCLFDDNPRDGPDGTRGGALTPKISCASTRPGPLPEKMAIMKFDPKARKHVTYKEIKLK